MRTTVGLPDDLLAEAKQRTARERRFAEQVVSDAVRAGFARTASPERETVVAPGPRNWEIFTSLCEQVSARGNRVPDAYLAALAIETGSEWITTDGDYRHFAGLRMRHPLDT